MSFFFNKIANVNFVEKMTIFVNFFEKMSSFWQYFDSQLAISGGSDKKCLFDHLSHYLQQYIPVKPSWGCEHIF